ncbi:ATP-binding protein [Lachnospiraceae bacterium LCP25S3_G4]
MEDRKRNPEVFLKQIEKEQHQYLRGKLKIFFGYAAGVGKTYAMLSSAQELKEKGVDVVAGYIEPHERPETIALIKGLETIPRKQLRYQTMTLYELDIDAALARRPKVLLVDELAHTNASGSRHTKRYQDIQELLKAGIDVYTTVNVQHLESLNDLVGSITQIVVRERIPDFVFDQADQVELVDIEPEELLERLKQGKIYKEKQVNQAMNHFFSVDNLVALRELSLRRMADRVNLQQEWKRQTGEVQTAEHILICLSASPSNEKVIRQAARMANAFRAKFTALFVETSDFSDFKSEDTERLRRNTRLAEQLGAKVVTSYGNDIVEQIAEYAKIARVSKIVLGRTYTKRGWFSMKESFSDKLSKLDPNLEVFLIPDTYDKKYSKKHAPKHHINMNDLGWDIIKSVAILVIATLIGYAFEAWEFSDANLIMTYILGILITSVVTREKICSIVASFISVLTFNFCFTKPIFTFSVNDPSYIATFGIMLATALIGASLTQKIKGYAVQEAKKAYRTEILLETSHKLQRCSNAREIALSTTRQLSKLLERTVIFYMGSPTKCEAPIIFKGHADQKEMEDKEALEVAQWVFNNNKHAGFSTTTLPGTPCLYLAIRNGDKVFGVIGIHMKNQEMDAIEEGIMNAILNECALALEKDELFHIRKETEIQLKQEKLRADLLRSISHDLRTPLTSISGNAGILMSNGDKLAEEKKHHLYSDIYDDAMWLINLVENLLSVTRIENGTMKLNLRSELLDEVIQEAMKHVHRNAKEYHMIVEEEDDMVVVKIDVKLILQVIINLVDNAIKYTPPGSTITIRTRRKKKDIMIEVADNGPGIQMEDKDRLFNMFYTGNHSVADGRRSMGMGLALCKSIITAHQGEIEVSDNKPTGTIFRFFLKEEEVCLHDEWKTNHISSGR